MRFSVQWVVFTVEVTNLELRAEILKSLFDINLDINSTEASTMEQVEREQPFKLEKAFTFKISRDILFGDIKIPRDMLRHVVDTRQFQLLDWRKQLGTAHLIYRNAHHTRLEHSFGVFELSRRFSSILTSNERTVRLPVTDIRGGLNVDTGFRKEDLPEVEELNLLHIAALIHDIGNYPFCHQLERSFVSGIPNHEQIGSMIIRRAYSQIEFLDNGDLEQLGIGERRDNLADIINTKSKDATLSASQLLFRDIISGPYGVDFLDYIYRDSLYCGLTTSSAVDFLLDHAVLLFDVTRGTYHFGFTQHVLHELTSLAYLRLDMERKVYSNKTHKIVTEMLGRAIQAAIDSAKLNINELCLSTDDGLFRDLERDGPSESRRQIQFIRSRRLYDVAYRFDALRPNVNPTVAHALKMWNLHQIDELKEKIWNELGDRSVDKEDVLISFPHPEERVCKEGDILILLESGDVKQLREIDPWISYYEKEYMNLRKYLVLLSSAVFPRIGDRVKEILDRNFQDWVLQIHGVKEFTFESLEEKIQSLSDVENAIVSLLLERGFTAEELSIKLGKARNTVVYHLSNLRKKGFLKRERRGKKMVFNLMAEYVPYISKSLQPRNYQ